MLSLQQKVELSLQPHNTYPGKGLTTGAAVSPNIADPQWQGHCGQVERSFMIDFGAPRSIVNVQAHFLQQIDYAVYFPKVVEVSASDDGINWYMLARVVTAIPLHEPGSLTQTYSWDGQKEGLPGYPELSSIQAQFIKLDLAVDAWVFIGGIEVWGSEDEDGAAVAMLPERGHSRPDAGYRRADESGGIHNLVLLYNGHYQSDEEMDSWDKDSLLPYIGYVNKDREVTDWLFDAVLLLGLKAPSGRSFIDVGVPARMEDWQWYLDHSFAAGSLLHQLEQAVQLAAKQLKDHNNRVKVVLMIPYPSHQQSDFGDLSHESLNFDHTAVGVEEAFRCKCKAIRWYVLEAMRRFEEASYESIELAGFYWMNENVNHRSPMDEELIRYTGTVVQEMQLNYYWIPYFDAPGFWRWDQLGFDAAALQPNHFFGSTDASRITAAANQARRFGMGVEFEVNDNVLVKAPFQRKYEDYLDGGITYGYDGDTFRAYYQDRHTFFKMAYHENDRTRELYDETYRFIKAGHSSKK